MSLECERGHFFSLHIKFEELYTNAVASIDELAERILTLGKPPHSTFTDYIKHSRIKETNTIKLSDTAMVEAIMDDFTTLIEIEREIMETTSNAGDDGTNDMINKFIQFQEKNNWMFRAFLRRIRDCLDKKPRHAKISMRGFIISRRTW